MGTWHSEFLSNPFEFLLMVSTAPQIEDKVYGGKDEADCADRYPEESADEDREEGAEAPEDGASQIGAPEDVVVDGIDLFAAS
jgi:hypothetical protein